MFHWEPQGRYCHRHCKAIVPFWFSTEHLWILIVPFWFSTEHHLILIAPFWFSTEHLWILIVPFWFSTEHHLILIAPFWFSTEHLWILIAPIWLSTTDVLFHLAILNFRWHDLLNPHSFKFFISHILTTHVVLAVKKELIVFKFPRRLLPLP